MTVEIPTDAEQPSVAVRAEPAPRPVGGAGSGHLQLAAVTVILAGILAAGSYLGIAGLTAAIGIVQALLVVSWVFGTDVPGRVGAIALGVLAAGGADAVILRWHDTGYSPVLGVLGVAIPLMFIHQLTRGVIRTRVVESLAGIAVMLVAVAALAGLLLLRYEGNGRTIAGGVIVAIAGGLVAAHVIDAVLPAPRFDPAVDRGLPAVVAGVVVGGAVGLLMLRQLFDFAGGRSAFVGAAAAAVACLLSIGATFSSVRTADPAPDEPAVVPPAVVAPAAVPSAVVPSAVVPSAAPEDLIAADGTEPVADADTKTDAKPAVEPAVEPVPSLSNRQAAIRRVAAVTVTLALSVPAAYVLTNALTS